MKSAIELLTYLVMILMELIIFWNDYLFKKIKILPYSDTGAGDKIDPPFITTVIKL